MRALGSRTCAPHPWTCPAQGRAAPPPHCPSCCSRARSRGHRCAPRRRPSCLAPCLRTLWRLQRPAKLCARAAPALWQRSCCRACVPAGRSRCRRAPASAAFVERTPCTAVSPTARFAAACGPPCSRACQPYSILWLPGHRKLHTQPRAPPDRESPTWRWREGWRRRQRRTAACTSGTRARCCRVWSAPLLVHADERNSFLAFLCMRRPCSLQRAKC